MRTIFYIIQKEFKQIIRDKFIGKAIIAMPIVQMLILVYAATFEIKNVDLLIVDRDSSPASVDLSGNFFASRFFHVSVTDPGDKHIKEILDKGKADVVLIIPEGFEKSFHRNNKPALQLIIDAVNGSAGQLMLGYCSSIIMDFNKEIVIKEFGIAEKTAPAIDISSRFWFNPYLNYKIFMAPGILVILVTAIGWFMTGMNLVKEKENGTIEQLNVTPIKKYQFILGKLIPFLIIGLIDLAFGLILARIFFKVPFEGSIFTLFVFATIYLVAVLGIGLFISTVSNTQQQVLFVSFFFLMVFVIMSGLFTSVENMPEWGRAINHLNPLSYFSRVIRMVLLKGSGLNDIRNDILIITGFALATNLLAVWRYKKTI
ncbi:MAG: ABC transporter permease [Bacteroidales bacterium]|nr:ABC transporter permease [Bacteroidales bacterium]